MTELLDRLPDVNVPEEEYIRLLGYPRGWSLDGRARELADATRLWYKRHGRPWAFARRAKSVELRDDGVSIDGASFDSAALANMLRQANADGIVIAAVSAGAEIEAQARQAWLDEKPDEYFFLEVFGSAVVEHLTTTTGAHLCAWAEGHGRAILPHYSPGYPQWDVGEQPRLVELVKRSTQYPLLAQLDVLDSGMLRPKKSQLAVFGVTRHIDQVRRLPELVPCESCNFAGCQYRRTAYRGPSPYLRTEALLLNEAVVAGLAPAEAPLDLAASYHVNAKALERWARERLTLEDQPDGTIVGRFRYEGTTCTNMGRPLAFLYTVHLGPKSAGYPILSQGCVPAPGDSGHRDMCQYLVEGERLLQAVDGDRPLAGARLDEALSWARPTCSAGCYCETDFRMHKWGLVLEAIHFALSARERSRRGGRRQEADAP